MTRVSPPDKLRVQPPARVALSKIRQERHFAQFKEHTP
jgi:hypothetical protein